MNENIKIDEDKELPIQKDLLMEGDYYINESGLWVFTEQYHLRRGYCCKNACKHCPYKKKLNKNKLIS